MSTSDKICKDGASIPNCDGVCEINDMLDNMSMPGKVVSVCANCGKEGDVNNICNKCKQVKYCNAACKKKHRHKHKKDCEEHIRLAAERATELHDVELFKQPPSQFGDCQICFIRLPTLDTGRRYQSCCGKVICGGCCYAPVYDDQGNVVVEKVCAFCRTPKPKSFEETIARNKKRIEADDPMAMHSLGLKYAQGFNGLQQDYTRALELWHRATELGCLEAYCSIGYAYYRGDGVEVDKKKSVYYYEQAAIGGDTTARSNLGNKEARAGNMERALKHYMIAARGGDTQSLKEIQLFYSSGDATKEDYTQSLQSYQAYLGEIKSDQRDKAAAYSEEFKYM